MSRPLRVFLCHASQDKPAVWKLYRYLKQRGVKPWLDQADLLPGENWEVEIPNALLSSDVILVCLSKNSVDKEGYVQKEISFALDKALEKPEGTIFVIPVKLEECELPRRLNRYQWVELFRTDGRKRLLMGLNKRVKELVPDVSPIILENTGKRPPVPAPVASNDAEREAAEKLAREKAAREQKEKTDREAQVRAALEKAAQEAKEKADREAEEFARRQIVASTPEKEKLETPKPKRPVAKPSPKFDPRLMGLGSIVLIALLFWGISAFLKDLPIANPQEQNTATATTPVLTKTPTKAPPTVTNTPPPTFTPTPGIGSIKVSEKDGMVMVFVPAGEFTMGNNKLDQANSSPIRAVYLSAFWIDTTEVTNKQYSFCVVDGICKSPVPSVSNTRSSYYSNPEFDNYPVIYVDWNMAKDYCEWAGRRLPTEAEWEKSARGLDGRLYPWGSESPNPDLLNFGKFINDTTEVAKYSDSVSPYGAYDMAGNVWEWVADWYGDYQDLPLVNPVGHELGEQKVLRGGAWFDDARGVSATYRASYIPSTRFSFIGFRCVGPP